MMYNSDTVYSTTSFRPVTPASAPPPAPATVGFRPVSPAPARATGSPSPAALHPSPVRTRKLETPLPPEGGLFSDIRTADGSKLLSTVTVDRLHSATRRHRLDEPSAYESRGPHGNNDYVDDIIKTETITNEDVIKVKFTPVPFELDAPRLLTPSQFVHKPAAKSPVQFIKDTYEDLQSYKMVNSVCKEKLKESDRETFQGHFDALSISEPVPRAPSPLANVLISEQLTKIDHYLQESLDVCSGTETKERYSPHLSMHTPKLEEQIRPTTPISVFSTTVKEHQSQFRDSQRQVFEERSFEYSSSTSDLCRRRPEETQYQPTESKEHLTTETYTKDDRRKKSKSSGVKANQPGVLSAIYNMPIHYHAMIICFLLIVYNLVYQYIKQNCHGNKK